MRKTLLIFILFLFSSIHTQAQVTESSVKKFIYKKVGKSALKLQVIYPPVLEKEKSYPAMVFFFGGGWVEGTIGHFEKQATYFASRGIVCFLVDYRVKSRHASTPFESLMDAKSSIRYIRLNAKKFNVDKNKIIASGGQVGGQLAAATALISKYNDPLDDRTISAKPNALVLFDPVIDNGPGNGTYKEIGKQYKDFSPLHNIKKGAPPTIIFKGTLDEWTPNETVRYYKLVMETVGSRCDLFLYKGQKHGFFNYKSSERYYKETVLETDKFLMSLGYLDNNSTIMNKE